MRGGGGGRGTGIRGVGSRHRGVGSGGRGGGYGVGSLERLGREIVFFI